MHDFLVNPAVQSGIIPFVLALITGFVLKHLKWYWIGLALLVGFSATVYLTAGFQFQPWTSTRKIIALGLGAVVLGVLLDLYPGKRRWIPALTFTAAGAATLWVIWPVVQRHESMEAWMLAVGCILYGGWCTTAMETLRNKAVAGISAVVVMGLGSGVVGLLGASALLGQLGLALGASAGGLWVLICFTRAARLGSLALLPAGVLVGLLGIGGHVYAKVPWYSLAALAAVLLTARMPLPVTWPRWSQGLLAIFVSAIPAALAVWLVYRVAGGVPM